MILSQKTCQEQQISIIYRIFSENKVYMVVFFFLMETECRLFLKKVCCKKGKHGEFIHDAGVYLHGNLPSRK